MILRNIEVEPSVKDLVPIVENSIINKVGINSEIGKAKSQVNSQAKITKSKFYAKSSKSGFFILGTRLVFAELEQAFMKVIIVHLFDLNYYIYIKTNISSYVISGNLN